MNGCDCNPTEWGGCIDGKWFGECEWETCGGWCEYQGDCICVCHQVDNAESAD